LQTISELFDALLKAFYETYAQPASSQMASSVYSAIVQLSDLPVFEEAILPEDLSERLSKLKYAIESVSEYLYAQERMAIFSHHAQLSSQNTSQQVMAVETPVEAVLDLLHWIKTSAKRYDKLYRSPIFGVVDVPQHFLEKITDLYIRELNYKLESLQALRKAKPLYTTPHETDNINDEPPIKDGEVMALYRGVKELTEMHKAFCPK
jgi:hypothetical protein